MKKLNILYWSFTGIFAAFMLFTAIPNIVSNQQSIDLIVTQMGYPLYFVPFIGVAKALGSIALVVPGFPRVKEWAYSGLMFDLVSATYSFIALGLPVSDWVFMFLPLLFGGLSYYFYHQRLSAQKGGVN